jgi:GNAT superfamily N-acetyltransferase
MDRDRLSAMDCNFLDAQRIFMGFSDTGEYVERRDVAIASCGLPARPLNWGFLKPPCDDVPTAAERVRAWFVERDLPYRIAFRGVDRGRCAPELETRDWRRLDDPTPGMTLPIPASVPGPPPGLAIHEVRTPEQLAGFREVAFRGFGYPVAAAPLFLSERLRALPQVRLYAGSVDGAVVATSLLVSTGSVAGIYWVATLEEQRGRGYGAALTWAAVAGGRELGCRIASLQASKAGRPVYERMGFEHVIDYEWLHPPKDAEETRA